MLDSLRADAVFGWRRLVKRKVTSGAAILSLALAIGACTAAFRLIDALLLRPLPVAHPERLYALSRQSFVEFGVPRQRYMRLDGWEYPLFQRMRTALAGQAALIAVSNAERVDLTYASDPEMEKAHLQFVSGGMFRTLGIRPAMGRTLTPNDDVTPGAHPVAILSHDYWAHRFGSDPKVVGRRFRMGSSLYGSEYEIVGVAAPGFSGTEPGTGVDIFLPAAMCWCMGHDGWTVFRTFVQLPPGIAPEPVRDRLRAVLAAYNAEQPGRGSQTMAMESAAAGASGMQAAYRLSLAALGVLVGLVLLIACANVANLMAAQASARAREMAVRVSIGAGRWRLVRLVLVESAWIASLAAALGGLIALACRSVCRSANRTARGSGAPRFTPGLARLRVRRGADAPGNPGVGSGPRAAGIGRPARRRAQR